MTDKKTKLDVIAAAAKAPADGVRQVIDMGHYGISIDVDGVWHHGGLPFPRIALAKLFATILNRDDDGAFYLATPVERGLVDVGDAPFVAVEMQAAGTGRAQAIQFRDNLDIWTPLDHDHLLRVAFDPETAEPRPYIEVSTGLEARLLRPVYYELADLAEEDSDRGVMGIWSHGVFHDLGPMEDQ
jgi:hypothetical protein